MLRLLVPARGPSSSSLSELSSELLRARRANGPALSLPGHLDSRKLMISCQERGLRLRKLGDGLPQEAALSPLVLLPPTPLLPLLAPGSFPAHSGLWAMPAQTHECVCVRVSCSVGSNSFVTPWTVAHQAPLSMGILQARLLEWVAMPSSRASSQPRD